MKIKDGTFTIEYKIVVDVCVVELNAKCKELTDRGFIPYGEPFTRVGYESSYKHYLPAFGQAFVKNLER